MEQKPPAELRRLRDLVIPAGDILLNHRGEMGAVDHKSATELVTDLDRRVEDFLVAGLQDSFPEDAIVAEEGGEAAGSSGRTWYIDPLDGTTNFVHGYPFYCVSVACAEGQSLLLAAVYAPYLDELYLAADGWGAELERPRAGSRHRLPRRRPVQLQEALLATGFPYVRDETVRRNTEYVRSFLMANCHGVRRGGSAAIDLCHVAAGKLDGFWEMKLRPWDIAAGTLLARQTGAVVSDFSGREGLLSGESILAAPAELHRQMVSILASHPGPPGKKEPHDRA